MPTPVPLSNDARPPAPALPVSLKVIISALVAGLLPALVIGLVLRFEVHMASWAINGAYVSLTAVFLSAMLRWLKPRLKPRHAVLIVLTWLSVSLLERLFLWHLGTARWFTLDLAPGNLKTALIWTLYGSILGLILSAALGRTRVVGIATGAIAFAAAGVLRGWLLQVVYAAFAEHGVVFFRWFSIVNVGTWFLAISAFLWFIRDWE